MAKKATTKSKPEPEAAAAPTPVPAEKPRARRAAAETATKTAKPTKPKTDKPVDKGRRQPTSASASPEPTEEAIRVRAYHRYLERGGHHGTAFEDWLEARRDLMKR